MSLEHSRVELSGKRLDSSRRERTQMEKNNKTEFVRLLGSTRLIVDGRTQIDFSEGEFMSLMTDVLYEIWGLGTKTTDEDKLRWLGEVEKYLSAVAKKDQN